MSNNDSIKEIQSHIISISKGKCLITDEIISNEPSEDIRNILTGLLYMYEDLELGKTELLDANKSLEQKVEKRTSQLIKTNAELTAINDSLDSFTYRLTHDLRAPAVNVHNMLDMLGKTIDIAPGSKTETIFNYAQNSSDKLLETMGDFLELIKAEKTGGANRELCNLSEVFLEVTEGLQQSISESEAKIDTNFVVEEILVVKEDLKSIFLNLIGNSIKYKSEKRTPVITIDSCLVDDSIQLSFTDNGIGIDLELNKTKLFTMFSRFHATPEISGTGIGLYLVKKLSEKSGGTIDVESKLNKSTTFTILLPRK